MTIEFLTHLVAIYYFSREVEHHRYSKSTYYSVKFYKYLSHYIKKNTMSSKQKYFFFFIFGYKKKAIKTFKFPLKPLIKVYFAKNRRLFDRVKAK